MRKFWIQIILLITLIFVLIYTASNPSIIGSLLNNNFSISNPTGGLQTKKLKIGQSLITVEIADTSSKRSQGLSDRESLPADNGMLFVFDSSKRYQFWMKGMKFSLDMIFIRNGKVVDILENVPNPTPGTLDKDLPIYQPTSDIDMVLEVNSGFSKQNNINVGSDVLLVQN